MKEAKRGCPDELFLEGQTRQSHRDQNVVGVTKCKWDFWNTPAIQLYLLSRFQILFCWTFYTSLLDKADAFFSLWHLKNLGYKRMNSIQLCPANASSQNILQASEMAPLDKTFFNIKSFPQILRVAFWWAGYHTKGHIHEAIISE